MPVEESRRLAESLPQAEFAVIADAGHLPHEEQPDATIQAVERFCEALAPDAQP